MQSPQRASRRPLAANLAKAPPPKPDCHPAAIPLPPSPPASDALILDELPPTRPSRAARPKTSLAIFAPHASTAPVVPATHAKRRRPAEDPFDSSSPPTSPTTRKSLPPKRLKTAARQPRAEPELRDSPNNPFLVQPGEKARRPGARRHDAQRQLVYVFRGKRIPYESAEDLDHSGGSPFALSGPKLLFPSPPTPTPAAAPALALDEEEPVASGSASRLAFETPKRDRTRNACPEMLPTPQSRPRKTDGKGSNRIPVAPVATKSAKTMARAMMR